MCHSTNPKYSWWSFRVFQSSILWVVWNKRAKNVEKKPSDVRYCYFYIKTDSIFVSIQEKSALLVMNFLCKHLCKVVFVEIIALFLTMWESICWYALVRGSKIYKIIKQTFYTSHLDLYNYGMGVAAALISRPHHRDFLCTKTNYQKLGGGLIGIGIDRDMKN